MTAPSNPDSLVSEVLAVLEPFARVIAEYDDAFTDGRRIPGSMPAEYCMPRKDSLTLADLRRARDLHTRLSGQGGWEDRLREALGLVDKLVAEAWEWGHDCDVDDLHKMAAVGDSHNESQREDVAKLATRLKQFLVNIDQQFGAMRESRDRTRATAETLRQERDGARAALSATQQQREGEWPADAEFQLGDRVTTPRAPFWIGAVCGWYRNSEGRLGFNVESEAIPLSIHNYLETGLRAAPPIAQEEQPS